ncbi:MAG: NUDIX hydrolase [Clostridia bacterium]|nr:NUDIX hydrolase [Clostridia bacterium]
MQEKYEEKILSAEPLFDGKFLHAQKLTVQLPNGSTAFREVTRHRRAVAIIPIWSDGTVTVVEQFRSPINMQSIEAPAGLVDAGEDLLAAAKRELQEETGITAEEWYYLATVASSPGFSDERVALYAATKLSVGKTHFDEDEFLVSHRISLEKLQSMILSGEVVNSSTVSAVLLACDRIRKGEIRY